jgi:hypothetical protein
MSKPLHPWCAEVEAKILNAIRHGVFPLVAAEAFGVPREVFADRLRSGESDSAPAEERSFRAKVREAAAVARLKAETFALQSDPLYWLKYGPGKETADIPGWSNAVKPPSADEAAADPTASALPLEALLNFIPELDKLPPLVREFMLTLMNQAKETQDPPEAS